MLSLDLNGVCNRITAEVSIMGIIGLPVFSFPYTGRLKLLSVQTNVCALVFLFKSKLEQLWFSAAVLITELIGSPFEGFLEEQRLAIFRMDMLWGNQSEKIELQQSQIKNGFWYWAALNL